MLLVCIYRSTQYLAPCMHACYTVSTMLTQGSIDSAVPLSRPPMHHMAANGYMEHLQWLRAGDCKTPPATPPST